MQGGGYQEQSAGLTLDANSYDRQRQRLAVVHDPVPTDQDGTIRFSSFGTGSEQVPADMDTQLQDHRATLEERSTEAYGEPDHWWHWVDRITGWASPEGEEQLNTDLAYQRAVATAHAIGLESTGFDLSGRLESGGELGHEGTPDDYPLFRAVDIAAAASLDACVGSAPSGDVQSAEPETTATPLPDSQGIGPGAGPTVVPSVGMVGNAVGIINGGVTLGLITGAASFGIVVANVGFMVVAFANQFIRAWESGEARDSAVGYAYGLFYAASGRERPSPDFMDSASFSRGFNDGATVFHRMDLTDQAALEAAMESAEASEVEEGLNDVYRQVVVNELSDRFLGVRIGGRSEANAMQWHLQWPGVSVDMGGQDHAEWSEDQERGDGASEASRLALRIRLAEPGDGTQDIAGLGVTVSDSEWHGPQARGSRGMTPLQFRERDDDCVIEIRVRLVHPAWPLGTSFTLFAQVSDTRVVGGNDMGMRLLADAVAGDWSPSLQDLPSADNVQTVVDMVANNLLFSAELPSIAWVRP